jgi:hypothetical protein
VTRERGSALVLAVLMLALLTGMAIAMALLCDSAMTMSAADRRSKSAYFLAEAAIEAGRQELFNTNGVGSFDDDLLTAAGTNTTFDLDPTDLRPVYSTGGILTGLSGYSDDVPLLTVTALDDGWYAVFLTNDDANSGGTGSTTDDNDRVMLTGVGADRDGTIEIVQAIIEHSTPFPSEPPALLTMFGSTPTFIDPGDATKIYQGDDCGGGGIPGFDVPVVGLIGTPAESVVEGAQSGITVFTSGGGAGHITIADLTDPTDPGITTSAMGTIDPDWTPCEALQAMAAEVRDVAHMICTEGTPCTLPPTSPGRVVFAEGDFTLPDTPPNGSGLLWVTGRLTMDKATTWNGILMVVGEGELRRTATGSGSGDGAISGAIVVADISGADNVYGTSDDCGGAANGFNPAVFNENLVDNGLTTYCSSDILAAMPVTKYRVASFRQR